MDEDSDVSMRESGRSSNSRVIKNLLKRVELTEKNPNRTNTVSFHGALGNTMDNSFSLSKFKKNLKIKIVDAKNPYDITFEMKGIDAPIANALRRTMISEIPTMAIERVVINNNTSVITDEILSHRLGLVPIFADPFSFRTKEKMFDELRKNKLEKEKEETKKQEYTPSFKLIETEDILFRLKVECKRVNKKVINREIYSKHLEWVPIGNQAEKFKDNPIRPVHKDILLCKLNPGQMLDLEIYCEKGVGKVHAKWSPVCPASYKLMPKINIKYDPICYNEEKGKEIKNKCKMNVFDIEDGKLFVKNARNCTMCRECIRSDPHPAVELTKVKDHFIFNIESSGILKSKDIFKHAIAAFFRKCKLKKKQLEDKLNEINEGSTLIM